MHRSLAALILLAGCQAAPGPTRGQTACHEAWAELESGLPAGARVDEGAPGVFIGACKALGEEGPACLEPPDHLDALGRFAPAAQVLLAITCLAEARLELARERGEPEAIVRAFEAGELEVDAEGRATLRGGLADLTVAGDVRVLRREDGRVWVFFPTETFPEAGLVHSTGPFVPDDFATRPSSLFLRDAPFVSRVNAELDPQWLRVSDSFR